MRTLLVLLLMCISGMAQTVEKRTGEIILLKVENSEPADSFSIYRRNGATSAPVLLGVIAARLNVWTYTYSTTMPAGSMKDREYLFWVTLRKAGVVQGDSNVAVVKRIK